jgi:hypothetical protein
VAVKLAHTAAGTLSVMPCRLVVSRTRIAPSPVAVSTQVDPPCALKVL